MIFWYVDFLFGWRSVQAKYFRISALVLELRMLIFFRSEKKRVNESAIRLSGTWAYNYNYKAWKKWKKMTDDWQQVVYFIF